MAGGTNNKQTVLLKILIVSSFLNSVTHAAFWRYIVGIQGQSQDPSACRPPVPTVTISAGTAPISIVSTQSVTCSVPSSGVGIVCTGGGTVTFDVNKPSGSSGQTTLNIEMNPPQTPFSCSSGLPVAQAYTLGQLCPDGSGNFMQALNCSPGSTFRFTGLRPSELGSVICVTDCSGDVCTQNDFEAFVRTSTVSGGCEWETGSAPAPTRVPNPPPVPAPTRAPVTNPPPQPNTCAKYGEVCEVDDDCCSDRCVFKKCQKALDDSRTSLADGRGGAAGVAKNAGNDRRTLSRARGTMN